MTPVVVEHVGVQVVRDDLFQGGTKARFVRELWGDADEVVYASPAEGGAQTALATVAAEIGRKVTIFVAKRATPHPRSLAAERLGAQVLQVSPGYLTVVQKRARDYAAATGARLLPFGLDVPEASASIAEAARATGLDPLEVWCAAGSGVLAKGLRQAWPTARLVCVQVGREVSIDAEVLKAPWKFEQACSVLTPFPSDPHYDAKAWALLMRSGIRERVVFWNVTGPA